MDSMDEPRLAHHISLDVDQVMREEVKYRLENYYNVRDEENSKNF